MAHHLTSPHPSDGNEPPAPFGHPASQPALIPGGSGLPFDTPQPKGALGCPTYL